MIFLCATIVRNEPFCEKDRPPQLLTLFGSPHEEGSCGQLLAAFRGGLPGGWRETVVSAYPLQPVPCDDCGYCHRADGCSKPDLREVYAALEEADALAVVTPVYNRSFPAPLKAVLDRTQRYWAARFLRGVRPPISRAKQVVLLTASGSPDEGDARLLEQQLLPALTIWNARLLAAVHYTGSDSGEELTPFLDAARAAASRLKD